MMKVKKQLLLFALFVIATQLFAQKDVRHLVRMGNNEYKDSLFVKAETNYRKGLDQNKESALAGFNLGRVLSAQGKNKKAIEQYDKAAKVVKDKATLASLYHNKGVLQQRNKKYAESIKSYKEALKNNPKDNETRYNLALAQRMLKQQQQKQKDEQKKKDKKKEKKKDKKKDQKQDQKKNKNKQDKQNKPEKKQQNKMSKQNAEQLLRAAQHDEKKTQEKLKKGQAYQGNKLEKDW